MNNAATVDRADAPNGRTYRDEVVLGFLGAVTPEKGIDLVIGVVRGLVASNVAVRARIAGSIGPAGSAILDRAREEMGSHLFEASGAIENASVAEWFSSVDLALIPSRYRHEAAPLVAIEALRSGVPIVATAVGCLPEMIDGWAVDEADFVSIAVQRAMAYRRDPANWLADSRRARGIFSEMASESCSVVSIVTEALER